MQPDQLGRLTLRQMNALHFHPRTQDGELDRSGPGGGETYEEQFRGLWQTRGATTEQAETLWQTFLAHEGAKLVQGVQAGILTIDGQALSAERAEALEEEWRLRWVEAAKRIMGHA